MHKYIHAADKQSRFSPAYKYFFSNTENIQKGMLFF